MFDDVIIDLTCLLILHLPVDLVDADNVDHKFPAHSLDSVDEGNVLCLGVDYAVDLIDLTVGLDLVVDYHLDLLDDVDLVVDHIVSVVVPADVSFP